MRKGHRRTHSDFISNPQQTSSGLSGQSPPPNQIFKLLEESQLKVESKVINFERLEVSSQQQNKYLSFGNFTLRKFNQPHEPKPKLEHNLLCIPETNKSSEISSQPQSREQQTPTQYQEEQIPRRKLKPNRGSDFPKFNLEKESKQGVQLPKSARGVRRNRSLKKKK